MSSLRKSIPNGLMFIQNAPQFSVHTSKQKYPNGFQSTFCVSTVWVPGGHKKHRQSRQYPHLASNWSRQPWLGELGRFWTPPKELRWLESCCPQQHKPENQGRTKKKNCRATSYDKSVSYFKLKGGASVYGWWYKSWSSVNISDERDSNFHIFCPLLKGKCSK